MLQGGRSPGRGVGAAQKREGLELSPGKCGEAGQKEEEVHPRRNNSLWELLRERVQLEDTEGGLGSAGGSQAENEAWREERWAWKTGPNGTAAPRSLRLSKRLQEAITFFSNLALVYMMQLKPLLTIFTLSNLQRMSMNIHMTLTVTASVLLFSGMCISFPCSLPIFRGNSTRV